MLFNTIEFGIFFIVVYALYLVLKHKQQNILLLVASYGFYAAWDWRFLSLLIFLTLVNYVCGLKKSKPRLIISLIVSLGLLGVFKYFNFFTGSFILLLNSVGLNLNFNTLNIILPLGISFYTFQTLSYTIDVYRGKIEPEKNILDFALYVSFFPQLVAGPIERASRLLPQIKGGREVTWAKTSEGVYLIVWGLFLKVYIADNLAKIVDAVYLGSPYYGSLVIVSAVAFAFQIFCDFAGYSNIARGLGKCLGFDIMVNFNLPYFATNPREFWQKWHISLSTWLRDYLYIPLGGNQKGIARTCLNLMITFILGGLWHGANITFLTWGLFHGILLVIHRLWLLLNLDIKFLKRDIVKNFWFLIQVGIMFTLTTIGWVFFRAQSMNQALNMFNSIFTDFRLGRAYGPISKMFPTIGPLLAVQLYQLKKKDLLAIPRSPMFIRVVFYILAFYLITLFGGSSGQEFIYFQF